MKIVTVLYRVFAQILSEISNFDLIFDKTQQIKDDVLLIKNVAFCENCSCILWSFCKFLSKISPFFLIQFICKISTFVLFFHEKQPKKRGCASHKKTLHFVKIISELDWVFAQFLSNISLFGSF